MGKPLRKAPIKYVQRPGEPTLEQKLKAYQIKAKEIHERKQQKNQSNKEE